MDWKDAVIKNLSEKTGNPVNLLKVRSVGGGSINETCCFETSAGLFFVKRNSASLYPQMFEKEAGGLKILADAKEIKIPEVIGFGQNKEDAWLILNFIPEGTTSGSFWRDFGISLSNLHRHTQPDFGLDHDNYIGSLHQSNSQHSNWADFFREERLMPQIKLARDHRLIGRETTNAFDRFFLRIEQIFPAEAPSLLHGDLWSGNFIADEFNKVVIIDPAVYYGHREMDLGMTLLFGGFNPGFYDAYQAHYPLETGWRQRMDYCNLYPLMVHVNLFGGSYLGSVSSILKKF